MSINFNHRPELPLPSYLETAMPKVGSKHFSYSAKGVKAAKTAAKKAGMTMEGMPMMKMKKPKKK